VEFSKTDLNLVKCVLQVQIQCRLIDMQVISKALHRQRQVYHSPKAPRAKHMTIRIFNIISC